MSNVQTSGTKKIGGNKATQTKSNVAPAEVVTTTVTPAAQPESQVEATTNTVTQTEPQTIPAGAVPAGTEAPAKKRGSVGAVRTVFDITTGKNADGTSVYNEEKKVLTGIPVNYDWNKNSPLEDKQFVDKATALDFKAHIADKWAERYIGSAKNYRLKAEMFRKGGNPDDTKKLEKMEKMRREYAAYAAQLKADGIEVPPLGA